MLEWWDIALRLGVATLAGAAIGLNRDLHGKPIGLRTLGIVSLATAMIVMTAAPLPDGHFSDAASRIVQGILTGIGFLGAGVIIHADATSRVRGLTSAACTWLTACVGILCGIGHWRIVAVGLVLTFAILLFGRTIEKSVHHALGGKRLPDDDESVSQPSDAGPHQPGK
jgi:putative Mg2+ transporter-C (MgtC) family protein